MAIALNFHHWVFLWNLNSITIPLALYSLGVKFTWICMYIYILPGGEEKGRRPSLCHGRSAAPLLHTHFHALTGSVKLECVAAWRDVVETASGHLIVSTAITPRPRAVRGDNPIGGERRKSGGTVRIALIMCQWAIYFLDISDSVWPNRGNWELQITFHSK